MSEKELSKTEAKYRLLSERCKENPNDQMVRDDKARAFNDLRSLQREKAREGDDKTPSKAELQREYIGRFPEEKGVREQVRKRVMGT